jgi:hypothetical protein
MSKGNYYSLFLFEDKRSNTLHGKWSRTFQQEGCQKYARNYQSRFHKFKICLCLGCQHQLKGRQKQLTLSCLWSLIPVGIPLRESVVMISLRCFCCFNLFTFWLLIQSRLNSRFWLLIRIFYHFDTQFQFEILITDQNNI